MQEEHTEDAMPRSVEHEEVDQGVLCTKGPKVRRGIRLGVIKNLQPKRQMNHLTNVDVDQSTRRRSLGHPFQPCWALRTSESTGHFAWRLARSTEYDPQLNNRKNE
jgi:hypothetical protein